MLLYHYTSLKNALNIFNTAEIHFTRMDFLITEKEKESFLEILDWVLESGPDCRKVYDTLIDKERWDSLLPNEYAICFSKERNNLSLWNKFPKANGVSIGFSYEAIVEHLKKEDYGDILYDMVYDISEKMSIIGNFIQSFEVDYENYIKYQEKLKQEKCDEKETDDLITKSSIITDKFTDELFDIYMSFRQDDLKDEQEVRMRVWIFFNQKNRKNYKVRNNTIIEYQKLKILPNKDIEDYYVHPMSSKTQKEGVDNFFGYRSLIF